MLISVKYVSRRGRTGREINWNFLEILRVEYPAKFMRRISCKFYAWNFLEVLCVAFPGNFMRGISWKFYAWNIL